MLWFNFILGSNFVFFCFWGIVMYEFETKENKFEPRIKLNLTTYTCQYSTNTQVDCLKITLPNL